MPSSKEVAKLAGVSVSTVCRVYQNDNRVSQKNREKVLQAARKLSYSPNFIARSLKENRSNTIGVVMADSHNPFYFTIIAEMERELKRNGYKIIVLFSEESADIERHNLSILLSSQVDGVVFMPVDISNAEMIEQIQERGVPILQVFRAPYHTLDYLLVDDELGTYHATNYLLQQGHHRILLITETPKLPSYRERGFQRAFRENGLPNDAGFVLAAPFHAQWEKEITNAIDLYKPTAVIAIANNMGQQIYRYCMRHNLNIPQDMSLLVYDDLPWMSMLDVSAVSHPIEHIGKLAGEIMLRRITKQIEQDVRITEKVQTAIVERGSVVPYVNR